MEGDGTEMMDNTAAGTTMRISIGVEEEEEEVVVVVAAVVVTMVTGVVKVMVETDGEAVAVEVVVEEVVVEVEDPEVATISTEMNGIDLVESP